MKSVVLASIKTAVTFLAASTLLLALAACGGVLPTPTAEPTVAPPSAAPRQISSLASTPTPTPTSTPAANQQTLPSPGDVETKMDCGHPMANSYDVASVATAPHYHWVYDIRVSGEDYHIRVTMLEQGGAVNEFMGVGGVNYVYTEDQWGRLGQYFPLSAFHSPHPIEGEFVVCPDLKIGPLTKVGPELLNDISVDHFRLTEGSSVGPVANTGGAPSTADIVDRTWDIWVDSNGQLVQTALVTDYAATPDYAAFQVDIQSTISGVGEPNIITAPTLPTPTPTPTATP